MEELRREIELQEHQAETEHETTENSCNVNLEDLNDDVNGTSEDNVEITLDNNLQNIEEKMRADGLGEEEIKIMRMMQEKLSKEEMQQPMSLRFIDRKKLKEKTLQVDKIIPYLGTNNLFQCNKILKAAGCVVERLVGVKKKRITRGKTEPWWKKRLINQINELRKEIGKLESCKNNTMKNEELRARLTAKYKVKQRGYKVIIEELKQRVTAKSGKIKRYENRIDQYQQNRLFENNQKRLFERLEGIERGGDEIPEAEASRNFWKGIWEKDVKHNEGADWIKKVETEAGKAASKQANLSVTTERLRKQANKLSNWKSPGPDGVQGYWIKNIKSLQVQMSAMFNECLTSGVVPPWLTKGKTVLIIKDKAKRNEVTNYRPITCLSVMWKLFTSIISEEIYQHLDTNGLLPEEQKRCKKRSRGTKDQLLIDKTIIRNCRKRQIGLAMGWIDYKKAFDMVPYSWILKCLDIFKILVP